MASSLDRVNRFLEGVTRNRRELTNPEGVALEVDIANHGERLAAFMIDLLFWMLATVLLFSGFVLLAVEQVGGEAATTIIAFLAFLLRNLYFIYFELTMSGSTPGKRIVGLRVINRSGGPLTQSAIVARNLTRELEVFLPLSLFFTWNASSFGSGFWAHAAYLAWAMTISALPFFNRDHLRAGDLIAGTMVISIPRRALLGDLVDTSIRYAFTRAHLEAYGAFELQVLEELLRRPPSRETTAILDDVCTKIVQKIGWSAPVPAAETVAFLGAFYTAQRAHLEREQLFGRYRADKTAATARSG
jgi:uncharacterized RDD family membrane protein YckC